MIAIYFKAVVDQGVLTPKTQHIVEKTSSPELVQNIKIGRELYELADRTIQYVPNHSLRTSATLTKSEREQRTREMTWMRKMDTWSSTETRVRNIRQFHLGQCYEYGILVEALGKEKFPETRIEPYVVADQDTLNVIGRNIHSNPYDFRTWGEGAVVLDCWSKDLFPVREIPNCLSIHTGARLDTKASINYPLVGPFDPQHHTLKPYSNPYG